MFDFQGFMQFANNPMQYMINRGIPQNVASNPQNVIQYLMNNGQLSQQQYNNIVNQANQLQKTPQFMQFLNNLNFPH